MKLSAVERDANFGGILGEIAVGVVFGANFSEIWGLGFEVEEN